MKKEYLLSAWSRMGRRMLLLIAFFTLHFSHSALQAQTICKAFYIYRNDGQFNAFFRDEVDSIAYSHFDADSVFYDEVVMQVVYTQDSIYRIPLAAVDSVAFVTPETKVNSSVFPLTVEHAPYISDADTLQFSMSINTPAYLLPNVGQIVVATADCFAFPDGIIAKIESREKTASNYKYNCSLASIDDVFDQILLHTTQKENGEQTNSSRSFDIRRASLSDELWNKSWTKTISGGGTTTTLNVGDSATVVITARKTLTTPFYFQLQLTNMLTSRISFNAKSTVDSSHEAQIGNTISAGKITVPYTAGLLWFTPKLSLYGYFEEEGKVELNYSGHFNRTDKVVFTYTQGQWLFNHAPYTDVGTDIANLSMDGHAEVGLRPQIDFSLNGRRAGFGMSAKIGLKEYINFTLDMTQLANGTLYDAMRDSYCRTTIPWSVTVHANADIFKRYDSNSTDAGFATASYTFVPAKEPQRGKDRYIFPLFSNVEAYCHNNNKTTATAQSQVSRSPLLPVQVGFSLIDKDKNIVQTKYDSRTYQEGSLFDSYSVDLSGVNISEDYTVRPSVKLMGYDVLASPSADVKAEETNCPDHNHPHMIDLGLPSGTKWACCNVGATTPEDYGNYYAWGETQPKSVYNWDTYQYGSDWFSLVDIGSDIAGTQYDAATTNWGTPWCMPSLTQVQELLNNCSSTWTTQNGVYGRKFTGSNGNMIFLPAAGYRWGSELNSAGSGGYYWSSTLNESGLDYAYYLSFGKDYVRWGYYSRDDGHSVRPVRQ